MLSILVFPYCVFATIILNSLCGDDKFWQPISLPYQIALKAWASLLFQTDLELQTIPKATDREESGDTNQKKSKVVRKLISSQKREPIPLSLVRILPVDSQRAIHKRNSDNGNYIS